MALPEVVTHRYHPAIGACRNLCSLEDAEALQVLDRLRREFGRNLKPGYLDRRRATERWLFREATAKLERHFPEPPVYFFLGDFSFPTGDPSRPAALVLPLSALPKDAITFTLGDSMSIAEQPAPRVYTFNEVVLLFAHNDTRAPFGLSNQHGFQALFIELQLWSRSCLAYSQLGIR